MIENNDDISYLVQETLDQSKNIFLDKQDFIFYNNDIVYPDTAGILFSIDKKINNFFLNIYPAESIKQEFEVRNKDKNKLFYYFETDYYEIAEVIKSLLSLKKFPLYEEKYLNIGDPSYSWWLKFDEYSLDISFKNSYSLYESNTVKLGPLFDYKIALERFRKSKKFFTEVLGFSNFLLTDNKISLRTENKSDFNLDKLKFALINGDINYLKSLRIDSFDQDLALFYNELVSIRSLWIQVEKILNQKNDFIISESE